MPIHSSLTSLFSNIANSIRSKGGTSATIVADNFPAAINAIVTDPSTDATVTSNAQILSPYTAYSKGTKYTGSIATKAASDVTVSGKTVTVPVGYYASQVQKSVADGALTVTAYSNGNIHVNVSTQGYVTTAKNTYKQYATKAATTITPSTAVQTAIAANTLATGAINVAAMPSGTTTLTAYSNGYVYANRTVGYQAAATPSVHYATKAAATITPSTSAQTAIAANTLATGAITVAAVANASAGNIKQGVTIAGVAGGLIPFQRADCDAKIITSDSLNNTAVRNAVLEFNCGFIPTAYILYLWNTKQTAISYSTHLNSRFYSLLNPATSSEIMNASNLAIRSVFYNLLGKNEVFVYAHKNSSNFGFTCINARDYTSDTGLLPMFVPKVTSGTTFRLKTAGYNSADNGNHEMGFSYVPKNSNSLVANMVVRMTAMRF